MTVFDFDSAIPQQVEGQRSELVELSRRIHANPELAFEEFKAARWLVDYLEGHGFSVERGIAGLDTAFRATFGEGEPAIAILAEYDALPKLGHACGHNLISTMAVGAGTAAQVAVSRLGGRLLVIGTPGEEVQGGKAIMAEKGVFEGLDAAMMVHPGAADTAVIRSLACQELKVEFFGRAAHAAARPEEGINALEAMLQSFNGINSLRQHIRDKSRIHGIITSGGEAPNIVPAYTSGSFIVRAEQDGYLDELKGRVLGCFTGAATATGARLSYQWGVSRYAAMLNNLTLAALFSREMASLGRRMSIDDPRTSFGSTDMGNVSRLVPAIHAMVAIAPPEVLIHSPAFAEAAAGEAGVRGMMDGAKAMALTTAELLAHHDMLLKIREEFREAG